MIILAIETSCDETACAIIRAEKENIEVLSNVVSSQIKLHAAWGGVVPNLAAREHLKNILPVIKTSLTEAGLTSKDIDLMGVTSGPGLIPALLIGVNAAKTLSYAWQKPLLGIHHIEGHIYANFIGTNSKSKILNPKQNTRYKIQDTKYKIQFPILCLVVSGGHTQLVYIKNHLNYKIIGQTLDDAAGEAFDKVARILGIGYPGGPAISQRAMERGAWSVERNKKNATRYAFYDMRFPRPMLNKNNFDFSFSGLKTAVLYETKKHPELLKDKKYVDTVCYEFQQAVIDVLISKTLKATEKFLPTLPTGRQARQAGRPKTIMLAGGVSANKELRKQLGETLEKSFPKIEYIIPEIKYSIDNASMIASAAYFRWQRMSPAKRKMAKENWKKISADANLKMKNNL